MSRPLALFALAAVLLGACTSDDPVAAADAEIVDVVILADSFSPASLTIKAGQTVRWTWNASGHSVTSGAECGEPDDNFSSGGVRNGGTFEHKFEQAGTFPYYCDPHCSMGMKGTITVQ